MTTHIIGTGSFLPEHIVTNNYLSTLVETNHDWIVERTGIQSRRIAVQESTSSMAIQASLHALENASLSPENIDLIITATYTPDQSMPNTACSIQSAIGAKNAFCFDLNAACTGFMFAFQTAHAYITSGLCKHALIVGSETTSRTIDWSDRRTCVLFGDGAGAAIISATSNGTCSFLSGSDGTKGEFLTHKYPTMDTPFLSAQPYKDYLSMDGQEIFKFAVRKVPESIEAITQQAGISLQSIKAFILHQANSRILSAVAKRLHVDPKRFPMNLDQYGNTSSASIPILLDELNRANMFEQGDYLILSGFGGGLTWCTALLQW